MVFEARYANGKLIRLGIIAVVFAAAAIWMALRPDGSFDDSQKILSIAAVFGVGPDSVGHGVGWLGALMGLAVLPVIRRQMKHDGPAIRIDDFGVCWHRWSSKPIGWSNIAAIKSHSIHRQKMIGLTLHNPALDPADGVWSKLASLNAMTGFGHVSLSANGTDKTHDQLLEAITRGAQIHEQSRHRLRDRSGDRVGAPAVFGRRV